MTGILLKLEYGYGRGKAMWRKGRKRTSQEENSAQTLVLIFQPPELYENLSFIATWSMAFVIADFDNKYKDHEIKTSEMMIQLE